MKLEGQANKDVFPCQRTDFPIGSVPHLIANSNDQAAQAQHFHSSTKELSPCLLAKLQLLLQNQAVLAKPVPQLIDGFKNLRSTD